MAACRRCPQCGAVVQSRTARPFCSERCRTIDLGSWLGEGYAFVAERVDVEHLSEADLAAMRGLSEDAPCD